MTTRKQLFNRIFIRQISILISLFAGFGMWTSAQHPGSLPELESGLSKNFQALKHALDDSTKNRINKNILISFRSLLAMPETMQYPFDSLKNVAIISSEDEKFTFFHWNIQHQNGKHRFYGFIRINHKHGPEVIRLIDVSDSLTTPESLTLGTDKWFGALYYKIITCRTDRDAVFYTMLGWSGEDDKVTSKVIEILSFDTAGKINFGLPVFSSFSSVKSQRIIYRYSASVSMALRFEKQVVSSVKKWNARKRDFDTTERFDWLIVADRLLPMDPLLEGQFQFYIPAGDIHDGFIMENGCWKSVSGLESRNITH